MCRLAFVRVDRGLLEATRLYVEKLLRVRSNPALAGEDLRTFASDAFATGAISHFEPYEAIHRRAIAAVAQLGEGGS
jgi:cyclase